MGFFDTNDKDNQAVAKFIKNTSFLICDTSVSNRVIVKKLLTQLGADNTKIEMTEDFKTSKKIIETAKPDYVFSGLKLYDKSAIDLFKIHEEVAPQRFKSGFFIISSEDVPENVTIPLEYNVDALITSPFTIDDLQKVLLQTIQKKMNPNEYDLMIDNGRVAEAAGDLAKAYEEYNFSRTCSHNPTEPLILMARVKIKQKNLQRALELYESTLDFDPNNFVAATFLYKYHKDKNDFQNAYKMIQALKEYPIKIDLLPEFTRVCIANSCFDDVIDFANMLDKESAYENADIRCALASGLIMCGNNYIENNIQKAKDVYIQAVKLSKGKQNVLEGAARTLLAYNEKEFGKQLLYENAEKDFDSNLFDALMYCFTIEEMENGEILTQGVALLGKGVKELMVYEAIIFAMMNKRVKTHRIKDMINDAARYFPEQKKELQAQFEQYLERIKGEKEEELDN